MCTLFCSTAFFLFVPRLSFRWADRNDKETEIFYLAVEVEIERRLFLWLTGVHRRTDVSDKTYTHAYSSIGLVFQQKVRTPFSCGWLVQPFFPCPFLVARDHGGSFSSCGNQRSYI